MTTNDDDDDDCNKHLGRCYIIEGISLSLVFLCLLLFPATSASRGNRGLWKTQREKNNTPNFALCVFSYKKKE